MTNKHTAATEHISTPEHIIESAYKKTSGKGRPCAHIPEWMYSTVSGGHIKTTHYEVSKHQFYILIYVKKNQVLEQLILMTLSFH